MDSSDTVPHMMLQSTDFIMFSGIIYVNLSV